MSLFVLNMNVDEMWWKLFPGKLFDRFEPSLLDITFQQRTKMWRCLINNLEQRIHRQVTGIKLTKCSISCRVLTPSTACTKISYISAGDMHNVKTGKTVPYSGCLYSCQKLTEQGFKGKLWTDFAIGVHSTL